MVEDRREPPNGADIWELFDHFVTRGLGNSEIQGGVPQPWTPEALDIAFGGSPGTRAIEDWFSHSAVPSPQSVFKIAELAAQGDKSRRIRWHDALTAARKIENRKRKAAGLEVDEEVENDPEPVNCNVPPRSSMRAWVFAGLATAALVFAGSWWFFLRSAPQSVENIRICSVYYLDREQGRCTQHEAVFMHGIDDVYLSFDLVNVPDGAPFERWWILNGERQAGKPSFNDEAWPGWTYWRPGTLRMGQYVVRVIVDGQVFTQTFQVRAENYVSEES